MKNYCLLLCTYLCLGFAPRLWAQPTAKTTLLEAFRKPDTDAKGMFRWWFPSAEADEQLIQEHIQSLYTAGFGGVEVALVPHNTRFDARIDGWGTEKWTNHIQAIQAWTHTFGYGYRAQAYGASIETSGASALLDVTGGESLGFMGQYEHFRDLAGGVHMAGKKFVSDEALANLGGTYKLNWREAARTLYENYAAGVNRAIFHGTSYPKEPSGQLNQWPGWHPFQSAFAEPWDRRQIFWEDVNTLANFVARTQAVLQNGQPQVDIAVYKNTLDYGKGLPELPKAGYTYDIIGTPLLLHKNARLNDHQSGQQQPTFGPAQYKAIVVNQQETTTLNAARQLLAFAKAGLPVILLGQVPQRLSGVSGEQVSSLTNALPTDAQLRATLTQLTDLPNAVRVADATQLIAALTQLNIVPRVAGKPTSGSEALQTVCRRDTDGTLCYYLFNNSDSTLVTSLQVEATGLPHQLSLWSGDIQPIARYTRTQTGTNFPLTLQPKEAIVIGFLKTSLGQKPTINLSTAQQTVLPLTDWKLQIESWGPGNDPNRPFVSTKTKLDLAHVSGIGYYITTFTPGSTWTKGQSVWLKLVNSDDIVAAVTINGTTVTGIDPMTLLLDIGPYVKPGNNSLQIKLVTTLINRVAMEHPLYKGGRGLFGPPPGVEMEKPDEDEPGPSFPPPPPMRHKFYYGLVGAELRMETR